MDGSLKAVALGRVQGVGYRYFVARLAHQLGLAGFARNLPDGRVEVEAEGEMGKLHEFLDQLRAGPPAAEVDSVEATWDKFHGRYKSFKIEF